MHHRFSFHSSYNLKLDDRNLLNFSVRVEKQHYFSYLQVKANALLFKYIVLGAGISTNDVADFNLGYRNPFFSIQLQYEYIYFMFRENSFGIQVSYYLRNKISRKIITNFESW